MVQSRTNNAKRNIAGAFANKIISMLLQFFIRTVIIYCLGTLYLGLTSLFTSILQVLSLAELGFGEAIVFSMYKPLAENNTKNICALLKFYRKIYRVIGVAVLAVGFSFTPFVPKIITGETPADINLYVLYFIHLFNTAVSYFLFAYKRSLLSAGQRSDITSNIDTISNLFMGSIQLILLFLFRNYYLYCIVIPLTTIASNIIQNYITDKMYPDYKCYGELEKNEIKEIKKRVTGLFLYKVCGVFRNSFDSIVVSAFLGLTILAKYNNYYYIINAVTAIMTIITGSIIAGVGNSMVLEDKQKNYKDFQKFQFIYMWLSSLCTVCLFCLYQSFVKLWVGEELLFDNLTMGIFCIYFFSLRMGDICYTYRQAAGLWWHDKFRPVVEVVMNFVLNIILVKYIGTVGVLLSTIICIIFINTIWGARVLFKYYFYEVRQSNYHLKLLYFGIITAISCAIAWYICSFISIGGIFELFARGLVCTIVSNIIMLIAYFKMPEAKESFLFIKKLIMH